MSRYAVVQVGSHQYQVEENSIFEVEKVASASGGKSEVKEVKLSQVLFLQEDGKVKVGQPFVPHASVTCEVLGDIKLPKVISFKFKRRKGYKCKKGHRQTVSRLRVKTIQAE
ncbi:MAG: 50S ribosomal protein L21 [Omnitrophica bacterium RIFCSPHIGHO2_02_FULL_46_11]|nr:MAG: 50S ribosomal protein L21 [Omnitrophica bacterium RIFCSPHIGHO2_02_FULL_46_11]OGW85912.1 MAG: 50S ribosomal protein L21 [Omnitrophica bacterium RIFCSPLOWO2_01_FULL_45_10b]